MKRMIQLTAAQHPDAKHGLKTLYIDPDHIIVVESIEQTFPKIRSVDAHRAAVTQLWQEVDRVVAEANAKPLPDSEDAAHRFSRAREAAAALQSSANYVAKMASEPDYHEPQLCTCVSLACGTALERGVMLARIFVTETPERVIELARAEQ